MSRIAVFMGSPRKKGNTDLLADSFIKGAEKAGARCEKVFLNSVRISPCLECGGCDKTGECVLRDDMTEIYPLISEADVVVVASPMFFYNITAATQALVERAQALWIRKYVLKQSPSARRKRNGFFISVGATRGRLLFDGACRVIRYFYDAIDVEYRGALLYRGLDAKGAVIEHMSALAEAEALGRAAGEGSELSETGFSLIK
jgi:multimeric flavodoxin WrbA